MRRQTDLYNPPLQVVGFLGTRRGDAERGPAISLNQEEATLRTEGDLSWDRVHRRACAGHGPADLTPEEVAWMDPVLYGRWVLGGLPEPQLAAEMLVAHGEHRTAESLLAVADAVVEQVGPMNLG